MARKKLDPRFFCGRNKLYKSLEKYGLFLRVPAIYSYIQVTSGIFKYLFQYKLLNNVLYLNKKLFHFDITSQSKCSFRELYDVKPHHIFYECTYAQNLWNQLRLYLSGKVALPILNPQSAIFGFSDVLDHNYLLVYHLLLIFKYNVYNSRVNNTLRFQNLKCVISQKKNIEETISENDLNKKKRFQINGN